MIMLVLPVSIGVLIVLLPEMDDESASSAVVDVWEWSILVVRRWVVLVVVPLVVPCLLLVPPVLLLVPPLVADPALGMPRDLILF